MLPENSVFVPSWGTAAKCCPLRYVQGNTTQGVTGRKNWNLVKIWIKGKILPMLILKHEQESTAGSRKQQGKRSGHKKEAHLATEHISFYASHTTLTRGRAFPLQGSFYNKGLPQRHDKGSRSISATHHPRGKNSTYPPDPKRLGSTEIILVFLTADIQPYCVLKPGLPK